MPTHRHRALVFNQIDPHGLELLEQRGIQIYSDAAECAAPDAILLRSHRLEPCDIPTSVQVIARAGTGADNIPLDHCAALGIPVLNTPGANANAVRELVLAAMLIVSRQLWPALKRVEALHHGQLDIDISPPHYIEQIKRNYSGVELCERTLGVMGLGAIGRRVASAALGLGMQVRGFDPGLSEQQRARFPSGLEWVESPAVLFGENAFLSLHVPLLESTEGMVDDALLQHCRPQLGSSLFNFSRAQIVRPAAVRSALEDGRLAAYASDFYSEELAGRDDVLCFPHLGASTLEAERNCAVMAARQIADFLDTGSITHGVNFSDSSLEWHTPYRLSVSNRNLPRQLNAILSVLADSELNVANMHNSSRGNIAYNLIDLDQDPPADLCARIQALDEIVRVRLLSQSISPTTA